VGDGSPVTQIYGLPIHSGIPARRHPDVDRPDIVASLQQQGD
jgi:hypothetical protein